MIMMNDFYIAIKIEWLFRLTVILFMAIGLLQDFAHAMTAQL